MSWTYDEAGDHRTQENMRWKLDPVSGAWSFFCHACEKVSAPVRETNLTTWHACTNPACTEAHKAMTTVPLLYDHKRLDRVMDYIDKLSGKERLKAITKLADELAESLE